MLRNENKAKKEKLFRDDDERHAKLIQDQIERGKLSQIAHQLKNKEIDEKNEEAKQVFVKENDVKLQFSLKTKKLVTNETADLLSNPLNDQQNKNKKNELTSKSTGNIFIFFQLALNLFYFFRTFKEEVCFRRNYGRRRRTQS